MKGCELRRGWKGRQEWKRSDRKRGAADNLNHLVVKSCRKQVRIFDM